MGKVKLHGWVAVTNDFELMMISALRYAIGRHTYMPSITIDYIRYLLPQLSVKTLFIMQRDIRDEVNRYECNEWELYMRNEWLALADNIDKEYIKKKAVQT